MGGVEKRLVGVAVQAAGPARPTLIQEEDAVVLERLGEPAVNSGRSGRGVAGTALQVEQRRQGIIGAVLPAEHLERLPRVGAVPLDGEGVVTDGEVAERVGRGVKAGHCPECSGYSGAVWMTYLPPAG